MEDPRMKWFAPQDWLDWVVLAAMVGGAALISHNLRSDIPDRDHWRISA
jgi:hypothetical protein